MEDCRDVMAFEEDEWRNENGTIAWLLYELLGKHPLTQWPIKRMTKFAFAVDKFRKWLRSL